jgi:hypothetical protein
MFYLMCKKDHWYYGNSVALYIRIMQLPRYITHYKLSTRPVCNCRDIIPCIQNDHLTISIASAVSFVSQFI